MATLLVAAGATAVAAPSAYADTVASLGVSPNHGSPDTTFTAIVRWQLPRHGHNRQCAPDQVTFTWDGAALGQAPTTQAGGACVAVLRATPPAGTYDGTSAHTIDVSGVQAAGTRYVVVASAAAAPTPTATDTAATADPTDLPSADGQTSGPAAVTAPTGGATPKAADTSSTGISLVMAFGFLLCLAGIAVFGALVWRARRGKAGDGLQPLPADPTRPLPVDATQRFAVDATQPLSMDATQPIPVHGAQPLPEDATQPIADPTQPIADPTRPLPSPRHPGDEQAPQPFQMWPPRPSRHSSE